MRLLSSAPLEHPFCSTRMSSICAFSSTNCISCSPRQAMDDEAVPPPAEAACSSSSSEHTSPAPSAVACSRSVEAASRWRLGIALDRACWLPACARWLHESPRRVGADAARATREPERSSSHARCSSRRSPPPGRAPHRRGAHHAAQRAGRAWGELLAVAGAAARAPHTKVLATPRQFSRAACEELVTQPRQCGELILPRCSSRPTYMARPRQNVRMHSRESE